MHEASRPCMHIGCKQKNAGKCGASNRKNRKNLHRCLFFLVIDWKSNQNCLEIRWADLSAGYPMQDGSRSVHRAISFLRLLRIFDIPFIQCGKVFLKP